MSILLLQKIEVLSYSYYIFFKNGIGSIFALAISEKSVFIEIHLVL